MGACLFLHFTGDFAACPVKNHGSGRPVSFYKNRGYKEIEIPLSSGEKLHSRRDGIVWGLMCY